MSKHDFTTKARKEIKEKFNGLCGHCGRKGEHIHHVWPAGRGGCGVVTNGLLLCFKCHGLIHKENKLLEYYIEKFRKRYGDNFYKKV